jgi:D-serine deaminase-like pyridoxal phosphate-dependent protein
MTRPHTVADIPTPALLVDVPAMERNVRRMAQFFASGPSPPAATRSTEGRAHDRASTNR